MEKLTKFFMQRRTLFWSIMIILAIQGIYTFIEMPKLEDPAIYSRHATVVVPYPGATAHEVELSVAIMVEEQLNTLPNVKKISTVCNDDIAMFIIKFNKEIEQSEMEQHFDLLRRKVNDFSSKLPQGTFKPIIIDDMMEVYGIMYGLTGEGYTYEEMMRYAKHLRTRLLEIDGVKRINIVGERSQSINITIDKDRLTANGFLPMQLMMSLQGISQPLSAGKFYADDNIYTMRVSGKGTSIEEIRNIIITTPSGKKVKLQDLVLDITSDYDVPQTNGFFVDGEPALAICVSLDNDAVVPSVGKEVEKRLQKEMVNIPAGIELTKIYFQPDMVRSAINGFASNVVESVLIVILILVIFMGWRNGLIVGLGLTLTILISFPILSVWGTTLQRISLGSFIVAMGMLVDNAVVIVDGIMNDRQKRMSNRKYLYNTVHNTAMPLLAATLIVILAFLGVYLSKGIIAEYASDLFKVLCVSLLVSWILAIIQIPVCMRQWNDKYWWRNSKQSGENKFMNMFYGFISRTIVFCSRRKIVTALAALTLLLLSVFGMKYTRFNLLPDFEYDQIIVECFWPKGTNADEVRDNLMKMTDELKCNDQIVRITATQGSAPAHYCLVRPMTVGGSRYGELMVDFTSFNELEKALPSLRESLREKYPDAYIRFKKYNMSIETSHPIEVEFSGPDPGVLRSLASQAEEIMRKSKYIDAYSVQNNWGELSPKLTAVFNEENALAAHVSRSDIANSLAAATSGMPMGLVQQQGEKRIVRFNVRNSDGSHIDDLNDAPVWTLFNMRPDNISLYSLMSGGISKITDNVFRTVPLSSVTDGIHLTFDENNIHRRNGRRAIEVECDPNRNIKGITSAKALSDIRKSIEEIPLPEGYERQWIGSEKSAAEGIKEVLLKSTIGVMMILIILLILFNSWKKICIIFLCLPFMICGIVAALLITGKALDFIVIIGLVGMIGMMIKNAIVLIDETDRLIDDGVNHFDAVIQSTISRTRPVIVASLTTIVGMIPLVGDAIYGSLAVSLMGGLGVGTLVTLVLIPFLYITFFRIKPIKKS